MADRDINILIKAKDMASKVIGGVDKSLGKLGSHVSKGLGNLSRNIQRAGLAVGVGLAGAVGSGIRSLMELERAANQTDAVLATMGTRAGGVTANQVRLLAEEIENLTTADDKAVQSGLNVLLTFGALGKKDFPRAAKAATNMAIALAGGDVEAANYANSAKLLGKALADPTKAAGALKKAGVVLTKQQQDSIKWLVAHGRTAEAQGLILSELEKRYGKAGEAAKKGAGGAWRTLKDIGEDLSMTLAKGVLPSLVKVSDWLTKKLADPAVEKAIAGFGQELGKLVDQGLAFVDKVDWQGVARTLGQAKDAVVGIVQAFAGMPDWVKTAVITGWGLNKLTGGAVGGIVTELAKGLVKGVLGITAGVVNIKAGSVVGGGGGVAAGGKGGGKGKIIAGAGALLALPVIAELLGQKGEQTAANQDLGKWAQESAKAWSSTASVQDIAAKLAAIEQHERELKNPPTSNLDDVGKAIAYNLDIDGVRTSIENTKAELKAALASNHAMDRETIRGQMGPNTGAVRVVGNKVSSAQAAIAAAAAAAGRLASQSARETTGAVRGQSPKLGAIAGAVGGVKGAITNKRWQFTVNNVIPITIKNSSRDSFQQTRRQGSTQTIR